MDLFVRRHQSQWEFATQAIVCWRSASEFQGPTVNYFFITGRTTTLPPCDFLQDTTSDNKSLQPKISIKSRSFHNREISHKLQFSIKIT